MITLNSEEPIYKQLKRLLEEGYGKETVEFDCWYPLRGRVIYRNTVEKIQPFFPDPFEIVSAGTIEEFVNAAKATRSYNVVYYNTNLTELI